MVLVTDKTFIFTTEVIFDSRFDTAPLRFPGRLNIRCNYGTCDDDGHYSDMRVALGIVVITMVVMIMVALR